ncbi:MAG: hypothetical protein PHH04_06430 [Thomasclavelia sp.]|nr:hypothetical protein [Thomasclavelia sp.]
MEELVQEIDNIKHLISENLYDNCEQEIVDLMLSNPHSPVPHNLYGIMLEKQHEHILAMKHFRAANALDPTYTPARYNLEKFGGLNSHSFIPAYCMNDCIEIVKTKSDSQFDVEYDDHHVGHMVRKLRGFKKR